MYDSPGRERCADILDERAQYASRIAYGQLHSGRRRPLAVARANVGQLELESSALRMHSREIDVLSHLLSSSSIENRHLPRAMASQRQRTNP